MEITLKKSSGGPNTWVNWELFFSQFSISKPVNDIHWKGSVSRYSDLGTSSYFIFQEIEF